MVMKPITSYRPMSVDEVLSRLSEEDCFILAGGTDAMVQHKSPRGAAAHFDKPIVFIDHLQELKQIYQIDHNLHIGACCTYKELLKHPLIPSILKKAIQEIAAPAIRNRGTIGGNICNASPAGDTLPLLYLYNALIRLRSAAGERVVEIRDFIQGPRRVFRFKDELVTEIIVPVMPENRTRFVYEKVANRRADAIAKLSFAASIRVEEDKIEDVRFAFGAVGPTVLRSIEIEHKLTGQAIPIHNPLRNEIVADFERLLKPIDDQRSTANYRRTVALRLLRHFLDSETR